MRFRSAAAWGWKWEAVSNWKLLTSSTSRSAASCPARRETTGVPILPPTRVFRPEAVSSSPSRVVVVVLPLVPLTARSGRRMKGAATSSSPTTGRPAARAAMSQGSSGGTPGDRTMASKPCQRGWATPRSSTTPRPWMSRRGSARSSGGAWSVTVTRAPCPARKRHRATPVRARPTTKMFFPEKSIGFKSNIASSL